MSANTVTITLPRPRIGRGPLIAIGCALAGALAATGVLALIHGFSSPMRPHVQVYTGPEHAFRVALPSGWRAAPSTDLARMPAHPLALLRSRDGRAAVVVQPADQINAAPATVTRQLTAQLGRRFKPFKPLAARLVSTRAGAAYLYAFAHGAVVQTVAVAAVGGRTYTINGIVPTGANDLAQQVGAIVGSFGS